MFDKTNFETLGKDIYVYKNFVSEEECKKIIDISESFSKENWYISNPILLEKSSLLLDKEVKELKPIQNRLRAILHKDIYMGTSLQITKMIKGCVANIHSDNLKEKDMNNLPTRQIFGTVMYFNNFDGGSLFYPNQNLSYNPKMGDLLIHSADEHCSHGVSELKSEVRYSHSNNLFQYIKVS